MPTPRKPEPEAAAKLDLCLKKFARGALRTRGARGVEATDISQDAWLVLLHRLRQPGAPTAGWGTGAMERGVVRNVVRHHLRSGMRRSARQRSLAVVAAGPAAAEACLGPQPDELARLPAVLHAAWTLIQRHTLEDVALILTTSAREVARRLAWAAAHLRDDARILPPNLGVAGESLAQLARAARSSILLFLSGLGWPNQLLALEARKSRGALQRELSRARLARGRR